MDTEKDVSDLSSELSDLDSEKEFADFDPTTMQLKKTDVAVVPKPPRVLGEPSPFSIELHRSLLIVFKRTPPYAPTYKHMREMRRTLLLVLAAWLELARTQSSDKQAYQHEALRVVDPNDDGVDDLKLLTAKVLNDALEEADWGFHLPDFESELEDHPINRTMHDMQRGMRTVVSDLELRLERGGFSVDNEQAIQNSRGSNANLRPTYVPATGRRPDIPQLNDSEVVLATNHEDVEKRSSNHPSRMDAESTLERDLYAQRVHDFQQRKMQYAHVAHDAAMKRRRQFNPNAIAIPPPGKQRQRSARPPPQQQSTTQPTYLPPHDQGQELPPIAQTRPGLATRQSTNPDRKRRRNFTNGLKAQAWSAEESLMVLQLRRDYPHWSCQRRVEELNRQMGNQRSVDGMGQHDGFLRRTGKTIEVLEKKIQDKNF